MFTDSVSFSFEDEGDFVQVLWELLQRLESEF